MTDEYLRLMLLGNVLWLQLKIMWLDVKLAYLRTLRWLATMV